MGSACIGERKSDQGFGVRMSVRHKYEYEFDPQGPSAPARVVRMVGKRKRVLEVGAGPGSITRVLKEYGHCQVTGLELDESAIEKLQAYCDKVYRADLNDPSWPELLAGEAPFEVIVAADVLEHVYDPLAVLSAMAGIAGKEGEIVVSLPHAGHNALIACLLDGDFQYRDWGLLDRTHIRFFGLKNMQQLFNDAGLKIVEAQFVIVPPEDTELAERWRSLPVETKRVLRQRRHGAVYQVVMRAVHAASSVPAVDLLQLPVVERPVSLPSRAAHMARRILGGRVRRALRAGLRK